MNYQKIRNPKTGNMISIFSATGKKLLKKYMQYGGHDGPCALNNKGTRCKKSKKWDNANCEISEKGSCRKKKKSAVEEKKAAPVLEAAAAAAPARKVDAAVQAGDAVVVEGRYTDISNGLTETQRKFCRCVLHLAKNNPDWCNREHSWPKRQADGSFKNDPRGKCYNPWAVCTNKLKRKGRSPRCDYLFTLPSSGIPYDEVLAYALLNYKKINTWCEENVGDTLDNIISSGDEDLVRQSVEGWYHSKA